MKNIFKLLAFLPLLTACDDLFEPALENNRDLEAMYKEPSYAQGILANAYIILPYETSPTSDLATDDAVTNEISSNYLRMATGSGLPIIIRFPSGRIVSMLSSISIFFWRM